MKCKSLHVCRFYVFYRFIIDSYEHFLDCVTFYSQIRHSFFFSRMLATTSLISHSSCCKSCTFTLAHNHDFVEFVFGVLFFHSFLKVSNTFWIRLKFYYSTTPRSSKKERERERERESITSYAPGTLCS